MNTLNFERYVIEIITAYQRYKFTMFFSKDSANVFIFGIRGKTFAPGEKTDLIITKEREKFFYSRRIGRT